MKSCSRDLANNIEGRRQLRSSFLDKLAGLPCIQGISAVRRAESLDS